MPTKRKPISRAPVREGLDDATLVTLCVEGPDRRAPFTEFDYTPERLTTFYREHESFLRAEANGDTGRARALKCVWQLLPSGRAAAPSGPLPTMKALTTTRTPDTIADVLRQLLEEQARQRDTLDAILRLLERGRGARDAADVALLVARLPRPSAIGRSPARSSWPMPTPIRRCERR